MVYQRELLMVRLVVDLRLQTSPAFLLEDQLWWNGSLRESLVYSHRALSPGRLFLACAQSIWGAVRAEW